MLLVVAILNYIFVFSFVTLFIYFFADESPVSRLPWCLVDIKIELAQVGKLIFASLAIAANPAIDYPLLYILVLLLADCFTLYAQIFYTSYLYFSVQVTDIFVTVATTIYAIYIGILVVKMCYGANMGRLCSRRQICICSWSFSSCSPPLRSSTSSTAGSAGSLSECTRPLI